MDVKFKKEYQYMPFIVKEVEDLVGGISIAKKGLDAGMPIPPGAFVTRNENGLGSIIATAKTTAKVGATATTVKVGKGHIIKVGDFVTSKDVEGAKAYAVTKIATDNSDYDVLTVGTTLGVEIPAGAAIIVVAEEDAVGGKSVLPPVLGITKNEIDTTASHPMTGVLVRGTVNVANMAFGAPKALREALPLIRFED